VEQTEQPVPEIIEISDDPEPANELSRKSASNGAWGREGSLDIDGSNSKHRLDDSDKDPNEAGKKENTPKRLRTAEIQVVDPSPESNMSKHFICILTVACRHQFAGCSANLHRGHEKN
jgi:hypothetical protein